MVERVVIVAVVVVVVVDYDVTSCDEGLHMRNPSGPPKP